MNFRHVNIYFIIMIYHHRGHKAVPGRDIPHCPARLGVYGAPTAPARFSSLPSLGLFTASQLLASSKVTETFAASSRPGQGPGGLKGSYKHPRPAVEEGGLGRGLGCEDLRGTGGGCGLLVGAAAASRLSPSLPP